MKIRLLLLLLVTLLAAGCAKTPFEKLINGPEVTLGAISLNATTKATTSVLPQDYRFRLYVLPAGVTDFSQQVATRTYTITDAAGTPTLDAGQEKLTLAIGNFDTYIVGPLMGVDESGGIAEIAGPYSINCIIGNDIVSSYTPLEVAATSGNILNPAPLNHRMAKAEMIVQRPDNAAYTDLLVNEITLDAQPTSGTFVLNADGISITPTASSAKTRKWVPTADAGQTKYVVVDYLFPQASKELKITTTFDATTSGTQKKYLQSGLVTTALDVATQHRFTAEPITPVELLWRLKLVPWVDNMSGVEMSEDVVFYFSGKDAPIYIEGTQYWPDRSGNGCHAKIVRDIIHDAADQCYRLKDGGEAGVMTSYLELPKLGKMTNYTLELVYKAGTKSQSIPVNFGSVGTSSTFRELCINLPWSNEISFLEGDLSIAANRAKVDASFQDDKSVMETMATWSFTRTPVVVRKVYRNGVELASVTTAPYDLDFDVRGSNSLLSVVKPGMCLYSVRMYRRVLSADQLAKNAENDRALYAKTATNSDGYVESGLILNLQGDQAPSTALVSGKIVWPDKSLHKNHAVYTASSSAITYNSNSRSYKFPAANNDLMKLLKPLGDLTNATVEIILAAAGNSRNSVLFFADDRTALGSSDSRRIVNMHYPYDNDVHIMFPGYGNTGATYFNQQTASLSYTGIGYTVMQYSIVRDVKNTKTLSFYQNNILQNSATDIPTVTIPAVVDGYIGGQITSHLYGGYIMALRVYNRPLTETERRINYEVDKRKYDVLKAIKTN